MRMFSFRFLILIVLLAGLFVGSSASTGCADDEFKDAAKTFRKSLKSKKWQERAAAYTELAFYDSAEVVDEVLKSLKKEKSAAVLLSAIRTLSQLQSEDGLKALVKEARKAKKESRYYMILALAQVQGDLGNDFLREELKSRDRIMAAQAALALGEKRAANAFDDLVALLGDEQWQLQAAAAHALYDLRGPIAKPGVKDDKVKVVPFDTAKAMQALVACLEKGAERGARREVLRTLEHISGKTYGNDVRAWRAAADGKDDGLEANPKHPPYVVGQPIYGQDVVIIVDNNTRLDEAHPYTDVERLQKLCEVPGGRKLAWMKIRTLGQFIRGIAYRAIQDMDGGTKVEVLMAGLQTDAAFGRLQAVNGGTRARVEKMFESPTLTPSHDAKDALETAVSLGGRNAKSHWKSGPDEIVYITSTIPWISGVAQDQVVVAAEIGLEARLRMLAIHLIGVGTHPQDLFKTLQGLCMGTYVDLER